MKRLVFAVLLLALVTAAALATGDWDRAADLRTEIPAAPPAPAAVARGAYLARVGHCAGCHNPPGAAADVNSYAGGRVVLTPFGGVVAANLTPDREHGLGRWTAAAFRRALQQGRSADGRALQPACPYPNFSLVSDGDADDLFAFLQSLPPHAQPVPPHALRFPYRLPAALTLWRWLNFTPARLPPAPAGARGDWARGAYLAGGLGHCAACHGRRDGWGATAGAFDLRGGFIPMQGWYAPSLTDPAEGALSPWTEAEAIALLHGGRNAQATVSGPMALVVARSLQHYDEADRRALAEFLRRLPAPAARTDDAADAPAAAVLQQGERLYARHCADSHGKAGEGVAGAADLGPALAGNRALALGTPVNVVRAVLGGGFGPATAAHPQPAGMPPFATRLGDDDLAAVVSFVRWQYGRHASSVDGLAVNRQR
jgi:mono/diheme cytochrome c family protein